VWRWRPPNPYMVLVSQSDAYELHVCLPEMVGGRMFLQHNAPL
jgi:hypothetical protein